MEPLASPLLWPRAIFHSPFSIFQPCTISEGPETPQKGLKGHSHLHHWQLCGCLGEENQDFAISLSQVLSQKASPTWALPALGLPSLHQNQELFKTHRGGFLGKDSREPQHP